MNIKKDKSKSVKSSKVNGLTYKQRLFIKAYKEGNTMGNGTRSAMKAGYSDNSAHVQASVLLKNPKVLAILNESVEEAEGVIISLMNDGEQAGTTRLAAAREVLDRTMGKAVQRSENVNVNISVESMLNDTL